MEGFFNTIIMKKNTLFTKCFNFFRCSEFITKCFGFLKMKVRLIKVHDKAIDIHKIVISFTRIFSFIGK